MRRLLAAAVVSLLLHVLVLSGAWLHMPETFQAPPPLEARLVSAPPPAAKPAAPPPKPRPRPARRHSAPPPLPAATVAASTPLVLPQQPQSPEPGPELAEPAAPAAEKPPAPPAPAAAPPRSLPRKGRITYTLFLGTDKFSVGKTVQSWETEDGIYKLASISETTGIAELFYSQHLNYLSEGRVTAAGLQPETFLMSRKRRDETEVAKAIFNWDSGQITLGRVQNRRTEALPAGSQDMVSFIYQLALAPPPPGRVRMPITNGSNLDTYELDVLKEESIETPLGTLKTLPVKQLRHPGEESIEFWLAADYRYLPVKIRFIGREGEQSGEQIVSEIRISDN